MPKSKTRKGHKQKVQSRNNEIINRKKQGQKAIQAFMEQLQKQSEEQQEKIREQKRKNLEIVSEQTKVAMTAL